MYLTSFNFAIILSLLKNQERTMEKENVAEFLQKVQHLVSSYRNCVEELDATSQSRYLVSGVPLSSKHLTSVNNALQLAEQTLQKEIDEKREALISVMYEVLQYVCSHTEKMSLLNVKVSKDHHYNDDGLKCDVFSYEFSGELGELINLVIEPFVEDGDISLSAYSDYGRKFSTKDTKALMISNASSYAEFLTLFKGYLVEAGDI